MDAEAEIRLSNFFAVPFSLLLRQNSYKFLTNIDFVHYP